ncbi:MAG: DNA polymerase/3'-5' exonuclease PolX [Deltaproteobacteria bacterium]|nr:MAG: DNA polymerase/3'-5' exonuclease PolX [Deltaproteobacteria bacterium]
MTPREVAAVLREISQLLQLKGENAFKVRAYDMGADAFETLPPDPAASGGLYERVKAGTLSELEGVGKAIDQKVTELVNTGKLEYLEKLRLDFPRGALDLVQIPGLGPRKAAILIRELDVVNLDDLEKAAHAGRVRVLKGFGEKTEQAILEGIAKVRVRQTARKPLWETRPLAEQLVATVRRAPGVVRAEIAGSVRRYNETNGDVDVVAAVKGPVEPVMQAFADAAGVAEVLARGGTKCSVRLRDGLQADLRVVTEAQFATALHHFTGSKQHHVKLRGIARDKGLSISEYGLARLDGGAPLQPESEEALYGMLGLQPVPPELREDLGELELAAKRELPQLVAQPDIRGFVHCHSTWSDGKATIEEMVRAAGALGAEFITITDHTRAAHYANGLDVERLRRQWDEIAEVQEKVPQVQILRGSEVDILEDGALDWPPDILDKLDVVICSVHQRFKLDEARQTERIRRALLHPKCGIWGHPTGRYLGDRDPMPARWEELIAIAAERGVTIECNGTPHRLDFSAELLRVARKHKAKICLSVDAHSTKELENLHYAVGTARRGWTERDRVINARPADQFLKMMWSRSPV